MSNETRDVRDYGLGDTTQYVRGKPRILQLMTEVAGIKFDCPVCHSGTVAEIEVNIENPLLKTGKGVGRYLSCPCCPWAAPMLMVAGEKKRAG